MEITSKMARGQNRAAFAGPEERQGLPERVRRGNRMRTQTCPLKRRQPRRKGTARHRPPLHPIPQADCLFPPHAYLEAMTVHFPFEHTYAALPAGFFARVAPTPVASPRLIKLNRPLAIHLGLDPDRLSSPERTAILAGKRVPQRADPTPMAHDDQPVGQYVPTPAIQRATLFGAVI